jgi:ribosomal protein S18 acetylase RimI-like enzyme
MSRKPSIPLTPIKILPGDEEYQAILTWPFAADPFYEGQVAGLLRSDIPFRVLYSFGMIWVYKDPDGNSVGFGTIDVCRIYEQFTRGLFHSYIPLLAVNPSFQRLGHGKSIVQHLTAEAALIARSPADFSDLLFLDVYTANTGAISLYEKEGFEILNSDCPILDSQENHAPYFVMAKQVSLVKP